MPKTPILIDTDMALDDWMAILYLLRNPAVQVEAITVAATGEAHARPGVRNALRLLALAGHAHIPVAAGSPRPLRGTHVFPLFLRWMVDLHMLQKMPRPLGQAAREDAAALICRLLEAAEEPLTVVALGPLTNLAQVFLLRPELTGKVAGITLMGGALDVPGNIQSINPQIPNSTAEWNIFIDPYAANVVFSSGVPVTVVPLDATDQVPLSVEYLEQMKAVQGNPALEFICKALQRIMGLSKGERTFYFWDPLAAVAALHPEIAVFEERRVRVMEEEGTESGRIIPAQDGALVRVCTRVDRAAFERLYLDGMQGI